MQNDIEQPPPEFRGGRRLTPDTGLEDTQPLPYVQKLQGSWLSARAIMNALETAADLTRLLHLRRMAAPPTARQIALRAWTELNFRSTSKGHHPRLINYTTSPRKLWRLLP